MRRQPPPLSIPVVRETPAKLLVRYAASVSVAVAAVLLRWLLAPSFLDRVPFLIPFVVVLLVAWLGGFGPALAATVVGILLATVYPALGWIDLEPAAWTAALLRFGIAGVVVAFLVDRLRRGERRLLSESDRRRVEVAQLAAIVESSDDAIISKTLDGVITSWNAAAERLYGYPAAEMIGRSIAIIVPPERPDELPRILERLAQGERIEHFETERVRKDGTRIEVSTTISPIIDGRGRVTGAAAIARDVSERRRMEEALRDSEERYRGIVSHAAVGIARIGRDGRLLDVNPGLGEMLGGGRERLVGTTYLELVHADDRGRASAAMGALLAGGSDGESLDLRYRRAGAGFSWVSVTFSAIRGADDVPRSVVAVALDVTQRRRTEATLRFLAEASESLSTLVDYRSTLQKVARLAVPGFADWCAVDLLTPDGAIERLAVVHVDPTKVKLAEELQRRYPFDAQAPYGAARVLRTGRSERSGEFDEEMLVRAVPDPELRRVVTELGLRSYLCVPLRVKDRTLGVISFIAAESARRYDDADLELAEDLAHRAAIAIENARLYQELRESDRRKDEFLAVLSHELRNPLAPIRSGIDMLAMEGTHESPELIELMRQQVEHLVRLVDDLLDLSRITRDRVELKRETIELGPLLERSAAVMRSTLDQRDQTLRLKQPSTPLVIDADPVRLLQVLENLLQNASKFSDAGSDIELVAGRQGDQVSIRVRDEGIGLDSALLPRLFQPFTQASRSIDRAQGGLGVGLALVRGLVERHGGTVTATSAGPGLGSEFEVRLPLHRAATPRRERPRPPATDEAAAVIAAGSSRPAPRADNPTAATTAAEAAPAGQGRRVLVVDDNVAAAQMLSLLVSRLGAHQVDIAHDGPSAIEKVRSTHPDVVLLDIGLPSMDGYEVGRTLRQDRSLDDVLIVALTGYGQEEDRRRSREAGIDEHLVKPAAIEDIERVLAHSRLSRR
jgi:PAS domain S-box-containing protein